MWPFPSLLTCCLSNSMVLEGFQATLGHGWGSRVWGPLRLSTAWCILITHTPQASFRFLLSTSKNLFPRVTSCLSPKPCPSPCWEALSEFRKQEGGAVLGQLLLSAQQPNRPPEEGTTKARHFVGKGSGEGTQWGQKMNGCHREGSSPLLF